MKVSIDKVLERENKTRLFLEGLYSWGKGFHSSEASKHFDSIVNTFIEKENLVLSVSSTNGKCAEVGSKEDSIYFHAQEVVFKGKYNTKELINSFKSCITQ